MTWHRIASHGCHAPCRLVERLARHAAVDGHGRPPPGRTGGPAESVSGAPLASGGTTNHKWMRQGTLRPGGSSQCHFIRQEPGALGPRWWRERVTVGHRGAAYYYQRFASSHELWFVGNSCKRASLGTIERQQRRNPSNLNELRRRPPRLERRRYGTDDWRIRGEGPAPGEQTGADIRARGGRPGREGWGEFSAAACFHIGSSRRASQRRELSHQAHFSSAPPSLFATFTLIISYPRVFRTLNR